MNGMQIVLGQAKLIVNFLPHLLWWTFFTSLFHGGEVVIMHW